MEFHTIPDHITGLSEDIRRYIHLQSQIFKCHATEAFGRLASAILVIFIIALLMLSINMFIGFAFISWYAAHVGPEYVGYLIVAGFNIILALVALAFRKRLFLDPMIRMSAGIIISDEYEKKQ